MAILIFKNRSTVTGFLGTFLITLIGSLIGLMMYAQYSSCDPVSNKVNTSMLISLTDIITFVTLLQDVQSSNEMLIFLITDTINYIPGFSGVFIAGLFCAALRYFIFCCKYKIQFNQILSILVLYLPY